MLQNDTAASIAKVSPPVGANFFLWLSTHDINWWVAVATLIYVGLQVYVMVRDKIIRNGEMGDEQF